MSDTQTAAARLNAVRRWHPTDRAQRVLPPRPHPRRRGDTGNCAALDEGSRIATAERDLSVARTAALAAEVARADTRADTDHWLVSHLPGPPPLWTEDAVE